MNISATLLVKSKGVSSYVTKKNTEKKVVCTQYNVCIVNALESHQQKMFRDMHDLLAGLLIGDEAELYDQPKKKEKHLLLYTVDAPGNCLFHCLTSS